MSEEKQKNEVVEMPEKFKALIESVEKMSVIELNELVKALEKKFGVSAVASVSVPSAEGAAPGGETKDIFTAELVEFGANKIAVIKVVKELLALGLKEAKDLVEAAPKVMREGMKKEEADNLKKRIEEAGGKVALK